MTELTDKAVWLEDMTHVLNVVELLERTYSGPEWPGALLFQDLQTGFLLVCCFDLELYPGELPCWESLFPPRDLREVTMEQACWLPNRYRPWLGDGIAAALRQQKLLPAYEAGMAVDAIILALQNGRPLSADVVALAKHRRLERIDELWTEIRILERLLGDQPYVHAALAERDLPLEAT